LHAEEEVIDLSDLGDGVVRGGGGRPDAFDELVTLLQAAADDPVVGHRLMFGQTTVRLIVEDRDHQQLLLLLDREPVEVVEGMDGLEAETDIWITSELLGRLWEENFHLAMAIAKGHVTFHGPVRKFLRVMPILQDFARRTHQAEAASKAAADGTATRPSDPPAASGPPVDPPTLRAMEG
jgi:hypothetical protein